MAARRLRCLLGTGDVFTRAEHIIPIAVTIAFIMDVLITTGESDVDPSSSSTDDSGVGDGKGECAIHFSGKILKRAH